MGIFSYQMITAQVSEALIGVTEYHIRFAKRHTAMDKPAMSVVFKKLDMIVHSIELTRFFLFCLFFAQVYSEWQSAEQIYNIWIFTWFL